MKGKDWVKHKNEIMRNQDLTNGSKLLYFEILALSKTTGYCYKGNKKFAKEFSVEVRTIQRWLKELEKEGLIKIDCFVCKRTGVNKRWLWPKFVCGIIQKTIEGDGDNNVIRDGDKKDTHR